MTAQSAQPLYIGGRPVDATSGETFTVTNPYDAVCWPRLVRQAKPMSIAPFRQHSVASVNGPP